MGVQRVHYILAVGRTASLLSALPSSPTAGGGVVERYDEMGTWRVLAYRQGCGAVQGLWGCTGGWRPRGLFARVSEGWTRPELVEAPAAIAL